MARRFTGNGWFSWREGGRGWARGGSDPEGVRRGPDSGPDSCRSPCGAGLGHCSTTALLGSDRDAETPLFNQELAWFWL